MNLSNSSNPSNPEQAFNPQSIGYFLSKQPANYYQNRKSSLLLFSADPLLGNLVRSALHTYTADFFDLNLIADGGNILENHPSGETSEIYNLVKHQDKTIILIGADPSFIRKLQNQWVDEFQPHCISYISDRCSPLSTMDLDSIYLKELNLIGFQRQHPMLDHKSLNYFRLGEFRNNASHVEPAIRRSEIIYFNLNAIRSCDCPGNIDKNPSGFTAEEASLLSRTVGMSERLKIFAISSWDVNKDPDKLSANLAAQMIWYFWEGCHLKKLDENLDRQSLTQYLVEIKNLDYIIKFYKSEKSGKWWFEEPLIENDFSNQLIPCSYDEYLATVNDHIPNRILEMINE